MATIVFFHAHPDDETIITGGTMAQLARGGHRVVMVTATKGEHGEVEDGFLAPGEELWQRRGGGTAGAGGIPGGAPPAVPGSGDSGGVGAPRDGGAHAVWGGGGG